MRKLMPFTLGLASILLASPVSAYSVSGSKMNSIQVNVQLDELSQEQAIGILTVAASIWKVPFQDLFKEYEAGATTIEPLGANLYRVNRAGGDVIELIWIG